MSRSLASVSREEDMIMLVVDEGFISGMREQNAAALAFSSAPLLPCSSSG